MEVDQGAEMAAKNANVSEANNGNPNIQMQQ